ncbi:MAG: uncharacterized protein QOK29_451, partial [Rhodospirillaceae bacterium]|nr:uncharacterized protein [Rhodospirillaceae bacterium]
RSWWLNADGLSPTAGREVPSTLRSPQTTGLAGGEWCAYGLGTVAPEMPLDQRLDDAGSLVFDMPPLTEALTIVGAPVVTLELASDKPQAFVAVRLSDVAPDGAATRVSYGVLNLTHRDSHAEPTALEPGRRYRVEVAMTEAAHVFAPGQRLRISVSTCYWPMIWPSPEAATLTISAGKSQVDLPVLPSDRIRAHPDFPPAEHATPLARTTLAPGSETREVHYDVATDRTVVRNSRNDGCARIDDTGTTVAYRKVKQFAIARNDPLTAETEVSVSTHFRRADWDARLETRIRMTADRTHFIFHADVDAFADGQRCFSRSFDHRIARDQL